MQQVIRDFLATPGPEYVVSTACPRLINGKPSANPRYLQNRPDLDNPRAWYLAEMGLRLHRRVPADASVPVPVDAVMPGRRNNPADPEAGIRPLAVYSPIHYQELPELFMDFIASLTGKSPSTTGAGSEGALTKGPFNAMPMIIDLNNALVSYILCGHHGFSTAAGTSVTSTGSTTTSACSSPRSGRACTPTSASRPTSSSTASWRRWRTSNTRAAPSPPRAWAIASPDAS
jgi:hypothetical protein